MTKYMWSRTGQLSEFIQGKQTLPMIIKTIEGYYGNSEDTTIEKNEIFVIWKIFNQERVIASNSQCILTIPLESCLKFKKTLETDDCLKSLTSILRHNPLPIWVDLISDVKTENQKKLCNYTTGLKIDQMKTVSYLICYSLYNDIPAREFIIPLDLHLDIQYAYDLCDTTRYLWVSYYSKLKSNLSMLPQFNIKKFYDIWIYKKNDNIQNVLPDMVVKPFWGHSPDTYVLTKSNIYNEDTIICRRPPMPLPRRKSGSDFNQHSQISTLPKLMTSSSSPLSQSILYPPPIPPRLDTFLSKSQTLRSKRSSSFTSSSFNL